MMKNLAFLFGIMLCMVGRAEISPKRASFVETCGAFGNVFNTDDFLKPIPHYQAISLRYARASNGSSWEDFAFNMPFFGIGFYKPSFTDNPGLGNPFSLYVFRGNTLAQFTEKLGLVWEVGLGLSMNWDSYDPFDNPGNLTIGSPNNIHAGLRLYMDYFLSKHFEMKFGVDFNHFSNGASRKPNKGVNMGALSVSLAYNFNPVNKGFLLKNPSMEIPETPRHISHDVQFITSSRQTEFSTNGTGLPSPYVDRDFMVLGLAYSPMIVKGYKYKWGPSVRFLYDESSNARAWRELNPEDGLEYNRIAISNFSDRLSFGLGLLGELSLPVASIFASIGYSVYHKHHMDVPFYQVLGVKAYLKDNFFATFGISATQFTVAQFLYWSFGYSISSSGR
ncbi:MAG: acyloxyacyl hydrolase [Bacteroidales bacterium]|nr:acyloxyacyl hydrolase [Bacteroidales bacterium]